MAAPRGRIAVLVALMALLGATAMASTNPASGRFDIPREGFAPASTMLRETTPEQAGLDPAPITATAQHLSDWTRPNAVEGHPLFAGAVAMLVHDGKIVATHATGSAVRYADGSGTELPREQQVPMRPDTIFDLASVTKLFTSIAVLQLVERDQVELDAPVARYLPEFGVNGKAAITVRQLLTHTSGLEPFLPLWRDWPDKASRISAVMRVRPQSPPGTDYTYSDLNLITLGVLVERLTGSSLDAVIAARITGPLGMADTGFNPPAHKVPRIAATEFQTEPERGMLRGEVHDENAWSLGGVAGHAGIFSTASDLAVLGQALLNGGAYAGERILSEQSVRAMLTNHNDRFPGDAHGLGFELDQIWYMGGLTSPRTAGHTGYTGTSLVIDPLSGSIAILLTNRVHPTRSWGSVNPARQAWATGLSRALAVPPARGPHAWSSVIGDSEVATLTTPALTVSDRYTSARFHAFVDSEPTDPLVVEASTDEGRTWRTLEVRVRGRGSPDKTVNSLSGTGHRSWWSARVMVPRGQKVTLRWRFTTDSSDTGRGVCIDAIRIADTERVLLDAERHPETIITDGFALSNG